MDKKIGYLLLSVGLLIILITMYYALQIFTGSAEPAKIINLSELTLNLPMGKVNIPLPEQFSKLANIFMFYLFGIFMIMGGGKIAGIGARIMKDAD